MKRARLTVWVLAPGLLAAGLPAAPPRLTSLFPAGLARGCAVEVAAAGSFDAWPPGVDVEGGALNVEPLAEKGRFRIHAGPGVEIGVRWLRFHDAQGATAPRPFVVGWAPEAMESEPNDEPAQAALGDAATLVVNGRLGKGGDVDCFAVRLDAGQTLVASLEAFRRLGSPMDGVLQVLSRDGFILAQCDDEAGLDPRITFQAPAAGRYTVRLFGFPAEPNSTIGFAGGEDHVYRLTLTTGPYLEGWQPLAVRRGEPSRLEPLGWSLQPGAGAAVVAGVWDGGRDVWMEPFPLPAPVACVPWEVATEAGDASAASPQALPFPIAVSGRLDPAGDTDVYTLAAPAGELVRLSIQARALGRPVDSVLTVRKKSGEKLAEADDAGEDRDAALEVKTPDDGELVVEVGDLFERGGWRHGYVLAAAPVEADVSLSLAVDSLVVAADKPAELAVAVHRRHGFALPLNVAIRGLPPGVECKPVESAPGGESARAIKLGVARAADAAAWSGPVEVIATAAGTPSVERTARAALAGGGGTSRLWLTVAGK